MEKQIAPKIIVPKALPEYEIRHHAFHYRGKLYDFNPKPMKKSQVAPDQALLSTVQANIKLLNNDELNRVFDLIDKIADDRKKQIECSTTNYLEVCQEIKLMKEKRAAEKRNKKQVEKAKFNPPVIDLDKPAPHSNKLDFGQQALMQMDRDHITGVLQSFNKEHSLATVDSIFMNRPAYKHNILEDMGTKTAQDCIDEADHILARVLKNKK